MTTTLSPKESSIPVGMNTVSSQNRQSPFNASRKQPPAKFGEKSFLKQVISFKGQGSLFDNKKMIKTSINHARVEQERQQYLKKKLPMEIQIEAGTNRLETSIEGKSQKGNQFTFGVNGANMPQLEDNSSSDKPGAMRPSS